MCTAIAFAALDYMFREYADEPSGMSIPLAAFCCAMAVATDLLIIVTLIGKI